MTKRKFKENRWEGKMGRSFIEKKVETFYRLDGSSPF